MPSSELLFTFLVATLVFAYVPGPAILYATAQTIARGRRAGFMAAFGIHLGCYVHVIAAAAGLSMVFHAIPVLYSVVKFAGALYLVWLGISFFRMKLQHDPTAPVTGRTPARRPFSESIAVEILNPKAALFFLAFLPQFVDASAGFPVWTQLLILGTVVNLLFSSADIFYVMLAGTMVNRLRRLNHTQRLLQRAAGTLLIGLGIKMAFHKV